MGGNLYRDAVEAAREYIFAGDIFQVVLAQRFDVEETVDPFDVYRVLRQVNPSPYMYFLRSPEVTLVGSSPEPMVQLLDGRVISRPIAGTRFRGRTEEHDRHLAAELSENPKERAEHVMLVDLARNDVGRVVEFGTEHVDELMTLERYSHVMHLTSQVSGISPTGATRSTCCGRRSRPGRSSGAPKVRAMEIIDELEPTKRGPYAGVVGYFDFSGNLDTAIAIRTMVWHDGHASVQAGAGIVADSVAADEDLECANKAKALLTALAAARELEPLVVTEPVVFDRSPVGSRGRGRARRHELPPGDRVAGPRSGRRRRDGGVAAAAPAGQARRRVPRDDARRRRDGGDDWWLDTQPDFGPHLAEALGRYKIRVKVDIEDRTAEHGSGVGGRRVGWAIVPAWPRQIARRACCRPTGVAPRASTCWARPTRCGRGSMQSGLRRGTSRRARGAAHRGRGPEARRRRRRLDDPPGGGLEVDAVSFTKGCFIGQELVCRIDSRGHVNRFLRRLSLLGSTVPPHGAEVALRRQGRRHASRARRRSPARTASSRWRWCAARSSRPPK